MRKIIFFFAFALLFTACGNDKRANDSTEETTETETSPVLVPGIGFKGVGNNPTWTLEMDFSETMTFISTESTGVETKIVVTTPTPYNMQNPNALRYRGESPEWTLMVTIFPFGCQDSKTGEDYNNQIMVKVTSKTTPYEETLQGCGNYQNGYTFENTEFN